MKTIKNCWRAAVPALVICLSLAACDLEAVVNPDIIPDDPPEDFSGDNGRLPAGFTFDWENYDGRVVTVNPAAEYQTMEGFAAADAWAGALVGWMWNDSVKQEIADFLFSREDDALGHPKGIGLSMWRINLGAGGWEQGDNSMIGLDGAWFPNQTKWNHTRRAECYLKTDLVLAGTLSRSPSADDYDWTKCAGHQYWMKEAKKRGTEVFVAACFSPVVTWTQNNWGYMNPVNPPRSGNLTETGFTAYPAYLADVADHFAGETVVDRWGKTQSLRFDYISPVNEPQFNWTGGNQEGSSWSNANIARLSRNLDTAIKDPGRTNINPTNTKILIPEAGHWTSALGTSGDYSEAQNQMNNFFQAGSNYVGNLDSMAPVFGGHTYWTHDTDQMMVNTRRSLAERAEQLGINVWNTEWCGLRLGEEVPNKDNATFFEIGHFVAKLIHADVAVGNLTSWSYWTSMDAEGGLKSLYSLIGISPGTTVYDRNSIRSGNSGSYYLESSGSIKTHATLWALGHFSLFVRPGFQRIDIGSTHFGIGAPNTAGSTVFNGTKGLMATAYKSPEGYVDPVDGPVDRIVVVYVNWLSSGPTVAVKFADGREPERVRCYMTNQRNTNDDIDRGRLGMRRQHHDNGAYVIPGKSIYTVVYDFDPEP